MQITNTGQRQTEGRTNRGNTICPLYHSSNGGGIKIGMSSATILLCNLRVRFQTKTVYCPVQRVPIISDAVSSALIWSRAHLAKQSGERYEGMPTKGVKSGHCY